MRFARLRRRTCTVVLSLLVATPLVGLPTSAEAAPAPITGGSFGMHWLNTSHSYPALSFGSARIWDMGVTWADLQPNSSKTDPAVLTHLDGIVATFRAHHADPMITLGMTPRWAAHKCHYVSGGQNWGIGTCAPKSTSTSSPWGNYIRMLAKRYKGKVRYYELWNEPSVRNGYNDSIATLAKMQATAHAILHEYGAKLVSPSIVFTNGSPSVGLHWLDTFIKQRGGSAFDVAGFHLYPTDKVAKAGWGPEWSMQQLAAARQVLKKHHLSNRPVWNTETNIGRAITHTTFTGTRGAAMVARTFILATENHVQRTIWYAADDRRWGGTWMEGSNYRSLTSAGHAELTAFKLLVGARPYGCSGTTVGTNKWHYTCRYHLANGRNMLAVWSTGSSYSYHGPSGTKQVVSVTGSTKSASHSTQLTVGSAPVYVVGTFRV